MMDKYTRALSNNVFDQAGLSRQLVDARRRSTVLPAGSLGLPTNAEQAFEVQRAVLALLGDQIAGWKSAGLDPQGIPLVAPILASDLQPSSGTASLPTPLAVEVEYGLRLKPNLHDYDPTGVHDGIDMVAEVFVALELCHCRLADAKPPVLLFLADGLANAGLVVGSGIAASPKLTLAGRRVQLQINGTTKVERDTSAEDGQLGTRLKWLAAQTRAHWGLKGGELVITGSLTGVTPLQSGDYVEASIEGIGAVAFSIAA